MSLPLIVLDACACINLLATGRVEEILQALPYNFALARFVIDTEILGIPVPPELDAAKFSPRLLRTLAERGVVSVLDPTTERERAELVRFATELDDGEASSCALAIARGAGVATDDRRAITILGRWAPQVRIHQTPELLELWAARTKASLGDVREVLARVRTIGRFYPRKGVPAFDWWRANDP